MGKLFNSLSMCAVSIIYVLIHTIIFRYRKSSIKYDYLMVGFKKNKCFMYNIGRTNYIMLGSKVEFIYHRIASYKNGIMITIYAHTSYSDINGGKAHQIYSGYSWVPTIYIILFLITISLEANLFYVKKNLLRYHIICQMIQQHI